MNFLASELLYLKKVEFARKDHTYSWGLILLRALRDL